MKFNLPEGWKRRKIKEICKVTSGKRPLTVSSQKSSNNSIPIYGGAGIMGYTNEALFKGPIIVTGRVGTLGLLHKSTSPCWPSDNTLVIIPRKEEDLGFIYYALKMKMSNILALNRGTSNPLVTQRDIEELEIYEPELQQEKAKISEILSSLDDKIELNCEMNKTLEAIAQAIFKNWFVDFEPFKNELVYNEELGKEIPKGWEVRPFSEVIHVNPTRKLTRGTLARKVSMSDLKPWQSWVENWSYEKYNSGPTFKNGDTLFARITPSLEHGKTALILFLNEGEVAFGTTEFIILSPKIIKSSFYVFCLSRTDEVRERAIRTMSGSSGRQRVPNDIFDYIMICVPPPDIVNKFDSIADPLFKLITINAEENRILAQIRDVLLPKLLSGEIRVKVDVEKVFPEEAKKLEEIREEKIKLQESLEKWFK